MKIKKLDNRFKLKKLGLATHMLEVDISLMREVETKMNELYGRGGRYYPGRKWGTVDRSKDWFYSMRKEAEQGIEHVVDALEQELLWSSTKFFFRVYFRREEQITFLSLSLQ